MRTQTEKQGFIAFLLLLFLTNCCAYARAKPQHFSFPVDCTLDENCWISAYADTDPDPENARDYTCSARTYEGHNGTDFTITEEHLISGVNVLAASDGKVLRIRDHENDMPKGPEEFKAIKDKKKDCGNGILIDHGNGLFTQYCHLRKDSILVQPEDTVRGKQVIAQIGRSGDAELPHLHFSVISKGTHVDPFTNLPVTRDCKQLPRQSLWGNTPPYQPILIHRTGFRNAIPDFSAIKKAEKNPIFLQEASKAFIFWSELYGLMAGDEIKIEIRKPNGELFAQQFFEQKEIKARKFLYAGRKLSHPLDPGIYTGTIFFKRPGSPLIERQKTTTIEIKP